jgi:signal transduction histidine kinase
MMITNSYFDIFENIPVGVAVIDLDGHILTMNKYAKLILNIKDKPLDEEQIHTLLGEQDSISTKNVFHTQDIGKIYNAKINYQDKVLEIICGPLSGVTGVLSGAVITLKDITEMEKNKALDRDKEKYTVMGEISADMAHEIRNPLGSIELLASLLKKESKRKKDINRANQIIAAVKTMENKISQLIHLSKTKQIPVMDVNIHEVLKDILLFSERIIDGGTVILTAQYADIEPVIKCNPDMMKQVFLNIILNALQETSRLDIITHHLEGCGMIEISFIEKIGSTPETMRSDILHRLSRTKEKNWGLGLAIVHNIVNMYKGYIKVEYLVNVGTAFVLSFPLVRGETSELNKINDPIENIRGKHEKK